MYQIIKHALSLSGDDTEFYLLFANKSSADILLEPELKALAESQGDRVKIHYTIDVGEPNWTKYVGFVSKQMLKESFPEPSGDVYILTCGPPPMVSMCKRHLKELGYDPERCFDF
jgi:cytochrome-b5 reductase